jgi:hypothetical protein
LQAGDFRRLCTSAQPVWLQQAGSWRVVAEPPSSADCCVHPDKTITDNTTLTTMASGLSLASPPLVSTRCSTRPWTSSCALSGGECWRGRVTKWHTTRSTSASSWRSTWRRPTVTDTSLVATRRRLSWACECCVLVLGGWADGSLIGCEEVFVGLVVQRWSVGCFVGGASGWLVDLSASLVSRLVDWLVGGLNV